MKIKNKKGIGKWNRVRSPIKHRRGAIDLRPNNTEEMSAVRLSGRVEKQDLNLEIMKERSQE